MADWTRLLSFSQRLPARTQHVAADDVVAAPAQVGPLIGRGGGRSFGDAAVCAGGTTANTLDWTEVATSGEVVTVGAGLTMGALADGGHWPPVAGGTRFATVGGAVASDIHGKNDVAAGSFGNHVVALDVVLASGEVVTTRPGDDLFAATVGGMGLTGLIRRVSLRCPPALRGLHWRTRPLASLDDLLSAFDGSTPYQAAWLDLCHARPRALFHSAEPVAEAPPARTIRDLPLPRLPLVKSSSARLLNALTWRLQQDLDRVVDRRDYVWSVDLLQNAHNLYGPGGFEEVQWACDAPDLLPLLADLRASTAAAGEPISFAMVKRLGDKPRAGLLSFPRGGFTLTANLPHFRGSTGVFRRFFDRVVARGGRTYLAKDAYIGPDQMAAMYPALPRWQAIVQELDPDGVFESDLSRRLRLKPWAIAGPR